MLKEIIKNNRLIAACEYNMMETAIKSQASAVIFMNSNINTLVSARFKKYLETKPIFIHFDLLKGLSGDRDSIKFLKNYVSPHGIVSIKSNVIRAAKKEGLTTIQRTFLIDTKSFENSIAAIRENAPDAVEIMPAIAPSIIPRLKESIDNLIIMGGLISEEEQIKNTLKWGADAVSLSKQDLWNSNY